MRIGIIGGGAAGFFCAINIKLKDPQKEVTIYEKTNKILSKVKISGGGRCNVTNAEIAPSNFIKNYPRGEKYFKKQYTIFNNVDLITWFEKHGVALKQEADGRIFPRSNDSQTIIDCFIKLCTKLDIKIQLSSPCLSIQKDDKSLKIKINEDTVHLDKIVLCTGGGTTLPHYNLITSLGHKVHAPIPSLFTFNLVDKHLCQLMGVVAKNVSIKIMNTNLDNTGDLLITHWGLSGPAVIKLSAFAALQLHALNYVYEVRVNWVNIKNESLVREHISTYKTEHPQKFVFKNSLFDLPTRLWEFFCAEAGIAPQIKWSELNNKSLNKLVDLLTNSIYQAKGKTTFKEEFVTCGGVDLSEIEPETMQSKIVSGVYFAGEVINIDGVTGGFNFQNAWSTAFVASQHL